MNRASRRGSAVVFKCPGCDDLHTVIVVRRPDQPDWPVWEWNGSLDRPTFHPSILLNGRAECINPAVPRCHSFVRDGRIQFLDDCSHALAGKTVDLPEIEA